MSPDPDKSSREPYSLAALLTARLLRLKPRHGPRMAGQHAHDSLEVPRWALSLGLILFLVLFLALLVLFFATPAAGGTDGVNFDNPTRDWYQGPVRYIITKQEIKAYKALETELERATFIDWFWQRRDIEPNTPDNEFRARFEKRTFEAVRKFTATTIPGWKTDMGKIYILVGPPEEIINDLMAKSHRGIVTWVYRRPPFPDLQPNTVIAFARDATGEFRLSASPTLDSDVARGLKFARTKVTVNDQILREGMTDPVLLAAGVSLAQGEIETRAIYGRMQQLPPREEALFQGFVTSREAFGTPIPMETRFDFYRAPGDTYTTVTVGIRSSSVQYRDRDGRESPDVGVFGKLVSRANPDESYPLASDSSFTEPPENADAGAADLLIFQAVGGFKPGLYRAILGVEDRVSRRISSTLRDIEVPDLSGDGLRLSSVTLATTMEPGDYAPSTAKPFQLGKFRVVPSPDNTFRQSDELNVYVQVYGPALDETTKRPKLDVLYTFRSRAQDGTMAEIGTYRVQDSPAQVQGYAVPLAKWPEGSYTVTVTIVDKVAPATVNAEAAFTIKP